MKPEPAPGQIWWFRDEQLLLLFENKEKELCNLILYNKGAIGNKYKMYIGNLTGVSLVSAVKNGIYLGEMDDIVKILIEKLPLLQ